MAQFPVEFPGQVKHAVLRFPPLFLHFLSADTIPTAYTFHFRSSVVLDIDFSLDPLQFYLTTSICIREQEIWRYGGFFNFFFSTIDNNRLHPSQRKWQPIYTPSRLGRVRDANVLAKYHNKCTIYIRTQLC